MNQTYDNEHTVIYQGRNYDKIYIPVFLKYNKAELPHYRFIKTINAGSSNAHILQGGNEFFMCMSSDENISTEQLTMEPMGFRRRSIDELQKLADVLCRLYKSERKSIYSIVNRRTISTVVAPILNEAEHWNTKMMNHYIINTKTKEEVHLCGNKGDICKQCGLTIHLLNVILRDGICGRDWCYKGTRVDGLTWPEYFSSRGVGEFVQTPLHYSPL
jgi:hypothetical protein